MTIAWKIPSDWPRLSDDEIHVWCVELDAAGEEAALAACLSEEERERANGLLSGTHQRRFVVARGMLRRLLGRYLDQDPGAVAFSRGAHGKPFLPEGGLHFNVSHTHELGPVRDSARPRGRRRCGVDATPSRARANCRALLFAGGAGGTGAGAGRGATNSFLQYLDAQGSLRQGAGRRHRRWPRHFCGVAGGRGGAFTLGRGAGRGRTVEVDRFGTGGRIRGGLVWGGRGLADAGLAALEAARLHARGQRRRVGNGV